MTRTVYRIKRKDGKYCIDQYTDFKTKRQALKRILKFDNPQDFEVTKNKIKEENKHIIFDNYDILSDENMAAAKEFLRDSSLLKDDEISESDIIDQCYSDSEFWFDDEFSMLKRLSEGNLIAIADLGLWNGHHHGYKDINSLEDTIYSSCDYESLYVNSNGDLCKRESHHDGTNVITFRYWKDNITESQKDNFRIKIYEGKLQQNDVSRYTRKAGLAIAKEYGWRVRGVNAS